ncbi:MAG: hypothetical protein LAO09_20050 [Acidobacteriia bacterium]|nr:hypothetical protein [Terriglobia bacterium]
MEHKEFWAATSRIVAAATLVVTLMGPGAKAQSHYKVLHRFYETQQHQDGTSPYGRLILDGAGNLYGTTAFGWGDACYYHGCGTAFKLTRTPDGTWTESFLAVYPNFAVPDWPMSGLTFDAVGNLYGTASDTGLPPPPFGGVFMLTPELDGSWTWTTIHAFEGPEGANPYAELISDASGNLYGTTVGGGAYGGGVVFKLAPNPDGSWSESVLYSFTGGWDGVNPYAGLVFDAAGNLYGTTTYGAYGHGTVFKLTPNPDGSWTAKILHRFKGGKDGGQPFAGLVFDLAGNLYGTTLGGGVYGYGVVFKGTPNADGSLTGQVLHHFTGGKDGGDPFAPVVLDAGGNLYGTTWGGGANGYGVVFKLSPGQGGKWKEQVLHTFAGNAARNPYAGVILDAAGDLYGTTVGGTSDCSWWVNDCGAVFEITP